MAFNVLVVDDSATVRAVLVKALGMAEVPINECHQAANGAEALKVLESHWIDMVFSDLNMPVMDGISLIERMAEDNLLKTVPVIVVSTEGSATRLEELKAKGVSGFVRKPFTPEEIRATVEAVVGQGLGRDDG
jgi:two-component system chemotaxis response regulator CheY